MKKFKKLDGEELELIGEIENYGILENEDGLYELCEENDERSFAHVEVVEENGIIYVGFNEVSNWADSRIVVGIFE